MRIEGILFNQCQFCSFFFTFSFLFDSFEKELHEQFDRGKNQINLHYYHSSLKSSIPK